MQEVFDTLTLQNGVVPVFFCGGGKKEEEKMGSKTEKRQLMIFIVIAYGIPYLLGLLMWYGSTEQMNLGAFPTTQMLYPAMGVMLAYLLTRKGDREIPKAFYISFILVTAVSIVLTVLSILSPDAMITMPGGEVPLFIMASQYVMIIGGIICLICYFAAGKHRRTVYGLKGKNWKVSMGCIALFLALYLLRAGIYTAFAGQWGSFVSIFQSAEAWIYIGIMPLNFLMGYIAFFGEEYGWRYYLQPLLQKKFGLRKGVLILGVVWGLWHLPLDFFFYVTPDKGLIMTVNQIITCVFLGIFMGYVYMKTENIWALVVIHFLNNNMSPLVYGAFSADVMTDQSVSWGDIPIAFLMNGVLFGLFILTKQYREKEPASAAEKMFGALESL